MAKARYAVELSPDAEAELAALRVFEHRKVIEAIREQLTTQPLTVTRNRKSLPDVEADFMFESPLWELRIGEMRVFYDANEEDLVVNVRAVRQKPPDKTTAEVLNENR